MLRKFIRLNYRLLSLLNTLAILLSGDPKKITKHLLRKSMYRKLGRFWR